MLSLSYPISPSVLSLAVITPSLPKLSEGEEEEEEGCSLDSITCREERERKSTFKLRS